MQKRREFLQILGSAVASLAGASFAHGAAIQSAQETRARRPRNILFLMCDQHNPDVLGRYGDRAAITPSLDALAASGTSFRQTYCQNPVCVPARNAILLSRYSHSMGVQTNGQSTPRDLLSLPQYLRAQGFTTGCFGKLHVLGRNDLDWDVVERAKKVDSAEPPASAAGTQAAADYVAPKSYFGAPWPFPETETAEWFAKEHAIAFLKANRERPWFIECSMNKPHPPFTPPQRYWDVIDRSKLTIPSYPADDLDDVHPRLPATMVKAGLDHLTDEQALDGMQGYYGNLAFADAMIGEVLKTLDALGLREDTLIVYTADHGEMLRHHNLWKKQCFFDQAVRVPLILSWPGAIAAGRESQAMIEHIDLFPTLVEMLGLEVPEGLQGESFVPVITGAKKQGRAYVRSEFYVKEKGAFRPTLMQFDGRYKFIDNGPDVAPELYDRQEDPREITNIQARPDQRERVERLTNELRQGMNDDVVAPLPPESAKKKPVSAAKGAKKKTTATGKNGSKGLGKNGESAEDGE